MKKEKIIKKILEQIKKDKKYNNQHKLDIIALQFYFKGDCGKISKDVVCYVDKTLNLTIYDFLIDYFKDIENGFFLKEKEEKILGEKKPIKYLKNIKLINLKQLY